MGRFILKQPSKNNENKVFTKNKHNPGSITDFECQMMVYWWDKLLLCTYLILYNEINGQKVRFVYKNIHKNITIFNFLMMLIFATMDIIINLVTQLSMKSTNTYLEVEHKGAFA